VVFKKVLYPGQIGIWDFCEGRNQRTQRKTPGAKQEPTTNSTHMVPSWKSLGHICAPSRLFQ